MRRAAPLLLMLLSSIAHAEFTPSTPPSWWSGPKAEWVDACKRADFFSKVSPDLPPKPVGPGGKIAGVNVACIKAVLMHYLILAEIAASADVRKGEPDITETVKAKDTAAAKRDAERNRDEKCDPKDPRNGNPGASMQALLNLGSRVADWQTDSLTHPDDANARGINHGQRTVAEGMAYLRSLHASTTSPILDGARGAAAMGVGVGAMEASPSAASGALPLLLTPEQACKAHPGLPGCPRADGT